MHTVFAGFGDRQMNRLLCALVTMLLASTTAIAADLAPLPYRTPPPAFVPVFTWTGFHVGGNFGGATTRDLSVKRHELRT
jgi:hypothetical protein